MASRLTGILTLALACMPSLADAQATPDSDIGSISTADFARHIQVLTPRLLRAHGVPGAAVGLIRNGEVVYLEGFGLADRHTKRAVTDQTVFNAGSIAKPVTAWGVMRLVEQGRIALTDPVQLHIKSWDIPLSAELRGAGVDSGVVRDVTVGRLLSHTAGVSLPAVPDVPVAVPYPTVLEGLQSVDHRVELIKFPGVEWAYSGGGFMILQLLIEEVSGQSFADFMAQEVFAPLGMSSTRFGYPQDHGVLAAPYDGDDLAPPLKWPGMAAADLYTTASDLARFVAASLSAYMPEASNPVLDPSSVQAMHRPVETSKTRQFGTRYGLGHDWWPLANGSPSVGHNGQNTGWSASAWFLPESRDGLVVLTNHSDGSVHQWLSCDWVGWAALPSWGGYCRGRDAQPRGSLATSRNSVESADAAGLVGAVDSIFSLESADAPGMTLVLRRFGREEVALGRGVADRATGRELDPEVPMYIASLAKPITAAGIATLIDRGLLTSSSRLGDLMPELPAARDVTIEQLVNHTGGVPGYRQWLDYSKFRRLDNRGVIDSLANHPELDFSPGARFSYSNSGYILLAEVISRTTGRSTSEWFNEEFFAPLALSSFQIDDGDDPAPTRAAVGYAATDDGFRLSNYEELELPGSGLLVRPQYATHGSGGVFASARDLAAWGEALLDGDLPGLPKGESAEATFPSDMKTLGATTGYASGWFLAEMEGSRLLWHDGNLGGFRSMIALLPDHGVVLTILGNRSDLPSFAIADAVLRRILASS